MAEFDEFASSVSALAEERYLGDRERAFAHIALQLALPTLSLTDDEAEDFTSVDKRGDLGADALIPEEEGPTVTVYQSKSSALLSDTEVHGEISKLIGVPSKLLNDGWVASAHQEMKVLANDFREMLSEGYSVRYLFATGSPISQKVRETFANVNVVPGTVIPATVELVDQEGLSSRYRKLLLNEVGRATNVQFVVGPNGMHEPPSQEPVIYLTIPAAEYVTACAPYGMELFRYNPRLYLGANKVNKSISETIENPYERSVFHLLNNGITAVCIDYDIADVGDGTSVVNITDFQVVNGCQTTMTLLYNSSKLKDGNCLIDIKVIKSAGLRDRISQTTNNQTSILAEDSFANEPEQRNIQTLFRQYSPPYFYAPKRGLWEQLKSSERRLFQDSKGVFGRYRKTTSKELAAVCLSIFGEPEAAKDKPRIVFEKVGGKNSSLYERIFEAHNSAPQWLLPVELFRYINALAKDELARDPNSDRGRVAEYGRFRSLQLAYQWLKGLAGDDGDFINPVKSEEYLLSIDSWAPTLCSVVLDGVEDAYTDARDSGESSGLREFFREKRHQPRVADRFERALKNTQRLAERNRQSINDFIGIQP